MSLRPGGRCRLLIGIVSTATVLLLLHVFEATLWALVYMALPAGAGLTSYSEAVYLSMVTITSLGYGDVVMSERWRLLGALEAGSGVLMFGVSTALFFAVITKLLERRRQQVRGDRH